MKITTITIVLALSIASAKEAHARRRHLNDILKGDESDTASILSDTGASSSKPKSKSKTPPTNKGKESGVASIWEGLVIGISRNPSLKDELFKTAVFGTAVVNGGTDDPRDIVDAYNNIQEAINLLTPKQTCDELFPEAALDNVTLTCCFGGKQCCRDVSSCPSDPSERADLCAPIVGDFLFGGSCIEA